MQNLPTKTKKYKTKKQDKFKQSCPYGNFFIYGKHPVFAALNNPHRQVHSVFCIEKLYLSNKSLFGKITPKIVDSDFLKNKLRLKDETINHQGIIAELSPLKQPDLNELISNSTAKDHIAILDQITDPHNMGAIIRSAAAFGINKIIVPNDHSPEENHAMAKTACGCLELVSITRVVNLRNTIDTLKKHNFWVAGLDASGKDSIDNIKKIDKLAIIIGSEGKGMRDIVAKNCDFKISIPIKPNVESLNASNAAAITFYALGLV